MTNKVWEKANNELRKHETWWGHDYNVENRYATEFFNFLIDFIIDCFGCKIFESCNKQIEEKIVKLQDFNIRKQSYVFGLSSQCLLSIEINSPF